MGSGGALTEWVGLAIAVVAAVVVWVVAWRRTRRLARATGLALLTGWAGTIVSLAFFPLPLPPYTNWDVPIDSYLGWPAPWAQIVPLRTIRESIGLGFEWPLARFLVGNVIAFAPLGFLAPLLWPHLRSWRRVLAIGLGVSAAIEFAQLAMSLLIGSPVRVADVDDLLLNTAGTLLGYAALVFVLAVRGAMRRARAA